MHGALARTLVNRLNLIGTRLENFLFYFVRMSGVTRFLYACSVCRDVIIDALDDAVHFDDVQSDYSRLGCLYPPIQK